MKIAIVGGTGDMGFGLALRLAYAGHEIVLGSRTRKKAEEAAESALSKVPGTSIIGLENAEAVKTADLVVISVPSAGHRSTIEELKGILEDKPILDITVPLAFKPIRYEPPKAGSNAQETAEILGENCRVAAGFHSVSAALLADVTEKVAADSLIVSNDKELKEMILELSSQIGITAYDAGGLQLASSVESQTPMLIGMNKRYKSKHIGFQLIGF